MNVCWVSCLAYCAECGNMQVSTFPASTKTTDLQCGKCFKTDLVLERIQ